MSQFLSSILFTSPQNTHTHTEVQNSKTKFTGTNHPTNQLIVKVIIKLTRSSVTRRVENNSRSFTEFQPATPCLSRQEVIIIWMANWPNLNKLFVSLVVVDLSIWKIKGDFSHLWLGWKTLWLIDFIKRLKKVPSYLSAQIGPFKPNSIFCLCYFVLKWLWGDKWMISASHWER